MKVYFSSRLIYRVELRTDERDSKTGEFKTPQTDERS